MRAVRRVFISHTSELSTFPVPRSFTQAAIAAVNRAGEAVVDMSYFGAAAQTPEDYCRRKLQECHVYVGILGHRYGSVVEHLQISYTEMEFRTAGDLGLLRLVFLLPDQHPGTDLRQEDFRRRVRAGGLLVQQVADPDDLEIGLLQSLLESAPRRLTSSGLRRTPKLALQVRQDGEPVPMNPRGDVVVVSLAPGPFELRLPQLAPAQALGICAYTDDSIFAVDTARATSDSFFFGPATGMADSRYGSSAILVTDEAHMHFDPGGRLERVQESFDSVYFGSVSTTRGRDVPLTEQRGPLFFVVARYDGDEVSLWDMERLVLEFD